MFGWKKYKPLTDEQRARLREIAVAAPVINQNVPTRITLVEDYEPRPCWVYGRRKALFHRWANNAHAQLPRGQEPGENARYYQYRATQAIVEYEDGTVDRVWPQDIQFADGGKFLEYEWLPREQEERNGDNQN
jgi:hypothetical protein